MHTKPNKVQDNGSTLRTTLGRMVPQAGDVEEHNVDKKEPQSPCGRRIKLARFGALNLSGESADK
jgi:hypothetical protein